MSKIGVNYHLTKINFIKSVLCLIWMVCLKASYNLINTVIFHLLLRLSGGPEDKTK